MKRLVTLLGVSALVATTILGSAGGTAPIYAQDGTPEATATPKPLGSEEGVLTVWVDGDKAGVVESLGKDFEAQTGVKVRIQTMGFGDIRGNFNIAGPAGEGPDLIVGAHDWIGELYTNGLLGDVELPADTLAKYDPVSIEAMTYDGKVVGVPYQVEAVAMYYNKDIVTEVPTTWDEAVALSKQLVADGKVEQGIAIPNDPYHTYPLLSAYGAYVFGRSENGAYDPSNVGLDSEGALKGAAYFDQLVKDGVFRDGVGYDQAKDLFFQGKLAMWITGPWELANVRKEGLNFGVAKIPAGTEAAHPFVGVQGFMVSSKSPNIALAQAFLVEYVSTDSAHKAIFDAKTNISAWLPTREVTLKDDADLQGFAASAADGQPMPAIPQMAAFWSTMGNAVTLIYQQKETPDKVMKDAATAAREEIAKSQ